MVFAMLMYIWWRHLGGVYATAGRQWLFFACALMALAFDNLRQVGDVLALLALFTVNFRRVLGW